MQLKIQRVSCQKGQNLLRRVLYLGIEVVIVIFNKLIICYDVSIVSTFGLFVNV